MGKVLAFVVAIGQNIIKCRSPPVSLKRLPLSRVNGPAGLYNDIVQQNPNCTHTPIKKQWFPLM